MTPRPITSQFHKQSAQVCSECNEDWPRHQHFCSAVAAYTRDQILREMLTLEDRMSAIASLTQWCVSLPKGDGLLAASRLRQSFALVRHAFWNWAARLEVGPGYGMPGIRALRDELRALRKTIEGTHEKRPPWKRRTNAA